MSETTYTASNDYHGSEITVTVLRTYETETAPVAEIAVSELRRAGRALCGHSDCICTGPHALTGSDGRVYSILPVE